MMLHPVLPDACKLPGNVMLTSVVQGGNFCTAFYGLSGSSQWLRYLVLTLNSLLT